VSLVQTDVEAGAFLLFCGHCNGWRFVVVVGRSMDCRERSSNKSSRSVGRREILAGVGHVVALSNAKRGVGDGIWMVEVLELARRLQPNFNVGTSDR
jgi:hypothetical protein